MAHPLCKMLEKEAKFEFDDEFLRVFESLKQELTTAPIIVAINWS